MFSKSTRPFILSLLVIVMLLGAILGTHQRTAIAKPNFPPTKLGNICSGIWDEIQGLRKKSDQQQGVLSAEDQQSLDDAVDTYNSSCRDQYGGNPRTVTGVDASQTGGTVASQPGGQTLNTGKKFTNNDFSKAKGLISGLENASHSIGNMTGQITSNSTGMLNLTNPSGNNTNPNVTNVDN